MKLPSSKGSLLLISLVATLSPARAADIERPKIQVIDKMNVNVATGQVAQSLETVSIGGAMGLSHSISVHANEFDFPHNFGFADKFWAETRYIHVSSVPGNPIPNLLRVQDVAGSADFRAYVNGSPVLDFSNTPPPYTYAAIGDERNSLVSIGNELIWTKPDGSVAKFYRASNATAGATGLLKEIVYPNGFTITIDVLGLRSVSTNTGFQLKYLYVADNQPMNKNDNPNLLNAPALATSFQSGWSNRNPAEIRAINSAIDPCLSSAATCTFSKNWPKVTFVWPPGMPRTMFIGDSQVRVIGAGGGETKFDFRAYDLSIDENAFLYPQGVPVEPLYEGGRWFSPRLVGVTHPSSSSQTYTYDYKTLFNFGTNGVWSWAFRAQTAGVIKTAKYMDKTVGYTILRPYDGETTMNDGVGGGVNHVRISSQVAAGNPDSISYVETEDGVVRFEPTARNWPVAFEKLNGPWEGYAYTRGNLTLVRVTVDGTALVNQEASYPASCTPANQKICNQAIWTKDARGKITDYTYHIDSGQVESIRGPASSSSSPLRPEVHYEYQKKRAHYYSATTGAWVEGSDIWMKSAESFCINSNFSSRLPDATCGDGDQVVTRYEYNHNNLLLTGMTVTSPATPLTPGSTLRTCFQYDVYGNLIGKTEPKANLSNCPGSV